MKRTVLATLLFAASSAAFSVCTTHDRWTGTDKDQHFIFGAGIGVVGTTLAQGDWRYGVAAAGIAAVAKEYSDSRHPESHTCSLQDALVTVAGGFVGAYSSHFFLQRSNNTTVVGYKTEF